MRRLIALDAESRLTTEHVALAAAGLKVSQRTVWRWIETARVSGEVGQRPRTHFVVTDRLRERLAFWRGNVAANLLTSQ
jgi:putative transposase